MEMHRALALVRQYGMTDTPGTRSQIRGFTARALAKTYGAEQRDLLMAWGYPDRRVRVTSQDVLDNLHAFSADEAARIPGAYNDRLLAVVSKLPDEANEAEIRAVVQQFRDDVKTYNAEHLIPRQERFSRHLARRDLLTKNRDAQTGRRLVDVVPVRWVRQAGDQPDPCGDAEARSPAPLDVLIGIAGSMPPVHFGCACDAVPETPEPAQLPHDEYLAVG